MRMTRRGFLAQTASVAAAGTLSAQTVARARAAAVRFAPTALHGYGTVSAEYRPLDGGRASVLRIACESREKALLTQAKYLSDLRRLPGVTAGRLTLRGRAIPVHRTGTKGVVACVTLGRSALIVAATDEAGLHRALSASGASSADPAEFRPRVAIPMYLDRWDRYGLLFYFGPNALPPGVSERATDFAEGLRFAADHGPAGFVVWSNPLTDDHGEGLTNEASWSWIQGSARRMRLPMHLNLQIAPPQLWLANRYREQTMLKAPQFLGGYYGVAHGSTTVGHTSWLAQEAWDVQLGMHQKTVRRFAGDPNIVGWLEPHGETGETPQKFFLEAGPYADKVWRTFLRKRYGTLAALSQRWHGDPRRLSSWSDVRVPEVAEFVGFGEDAIDLRGTWRVQYSPAAGTPVEWLGPAFDDTGWPELVAPGNDRMLSLERRPILYRRTVDVPAGWLRAHGNAMLVVWDMSSADRETPTLHVNGAQVPAHGHRWRDQHWTHFDVSAALRPGPNALALEIPRALICYRAYLADGPLHEYPYLGEGKNAQWVDFVEWNTESRGDQIRRGAEMIRQVDRHSSINFMAPYDYYEPIARICKDYGGRFHDTGGMAGYWTEWNTLMMSGAGLPVTAEAGNGAPNIRELQLFWGRWLTEGVNGIHYFQNWGEIAWAPEIRQVFERNMAMYEAVGKYHSPFAQVAALFSMQNDYLTGFPWSQDTADSRGGENSAYNAAGHLIDYCPRDGVCAADFDSPDIGRYRAVIDTNSRFMSDRLLQGIGRYVRAGGIFITYGQSGRHAPTKPDTWPISGLTGYSVARIIGWGDGKSASPAPNQSVLTAADLPDRSRALGLSLRPTAPECRSLATWDDGTTAIGLRPVGKGCVVQFGPDFRDARFAAIIGAILRHFGVTDRVPASVAPQRGLHFRHFVGNTGLHDVWVLFNESDAEMTTDLTFLPGVHPASLTDIVTGAEARIARDPAGDSVRGIMLPKWESRMYVSPRADTAASPVEWFRLQRGWWQGTKTPPARHLPTPAEIQRHVVDLSEGWAHRNGAGLTDAQVEALLQSGVDDRAWERRVLELWLTPGDRSPKRHVLRRTFTVPARWADGKIALCADIPGAQFAFETRVFLDGKPWNDGRKTVDGPYLDPMGGALRPGSTHLLGLDIAGEGTLTGSHGPVWLTYLPNPQARQDLSGRWVAYRDALHRDGEVELPGPAVKGMFLSRRVRIDAVHSRRNVVLYFEAGYGRYGIIVNGHRLDTSDLPRTHAYTFNVTPFVRFGEENDIELAGSPGEKPIQLVELRYYDKGVYP